MLPNNLESVLFSEIFTRSPDLISVGIVIAIIGILGLVVFFNNTKSITNRIFLAFSLLTIAYGAVNFLNYKVHTPFVVLILLRLTVFFAVWHAFSLFTLIYVFPNEKIKFPKSFVFLFFPLVILTSIINLTHLVFPGVAQIGNGSTATTATVGPGIYLFVAVVITILIGTFILLIKKTSKAEGLLKKQFQFIAVGTIITFTLLVIFVLLLPALYLNVQFIPFAPLFLLPLIIFAAYSIIKYHLFNIKIIATQLLIFSLWIFLLVRTLIANTFQDLIIELILLVITVFIGSLLIKSVLKEVEQREKIEKQEKDLEVANKGQEDLIHIINHQIKGYLTKGRIIFSELLSEPEYGPINYPAKTMMEQGLGFLTEGVDFVQGVLNSSNVEAGTFTYTMQSVDLKSLITDVADKQRENAVAKGLSYDVTIADGDYMTMGDPAQLKEAFKNLIDNSIHYTLKGGVHVSLSRQKSPDPKAGETFLFAVIDTGIGLNDEDKPRLFTKGGRGKDSLKVNVNSTGYGLSFVKGVIEAHKGRVWAESQGPGKGSQFYAELPAKV